MGGLEVDDYANRDIQVTHPGFEMWNTYWEFVANITCKAVAGRLCALTAGLGGIGCTMWG